MRNTPTKLSPKELRERELAQYMADMLLEMRNLAKHNNFNTLLSLLEISYCEAFAIANRVEVPPGEVERIYDMGKQARAVG